MTCTAYLDIEGRARLRCVVEEGHYSSSSERYHRSGPVGEDETVFWMDDAKGAGYGAPGLNPYGILIDAVNEFNMTVERATERLIERTAGLLTAEAPHECMYGGREQDFECSLCGKSKPAKQWLNHIDGECSYSCTHDIHRPKQ